MASGRIISACSGNCAFSIEIFLVFWPFIRISWEESFPVILTHQGSRTSNRVNLPTRFPVFPEIVDTPDFKKHGTLLWHFRQTARLSNQLIMYKAVDWWWARWGIWRQYGVVGVSCSQLKTHCFWVKFREPHGFIMCVLSAKASSATITRRRVTQWHYQNSASDSQVESVIRRIQ